ncbi:AraC family transcriptional regulator [Acidisoma silvae]|uniref:Helix-turn-helix domain-containing protein n=1 Tax=Acidisoma silvae TaxID=2802396 RepID=A0A963YV60_9PROT|nr:AraC family transcriptional regulator [Acidisoma silvae]MCB8877167.1 helix-turn-helix domain-containing protein [Acidisoma silvae]
MSAISHAIPTFCNAPVVGLTPKANSLTQIKITQSGVLARHLGDHILESLGQKTISLLGNREPTRHSSDFAAEYSTIHVSGLLENAARSMRDPVLGIDIGMTYSLLEAISAIIPARKDVTLLSLIRDLSKQFFAMQSDAKLLLTIEGDEAVFEYQYWNGLDERRRQLPELILASLVKMLRMILPYELWPRSVVFPHLRGSDQERIKKQLGMSASFGVTRHAAIMLPKAALSHVCVLPDSGAKFGALNGPEWARYEALVPRIAFCVRRYAVDCTKGLAAVTQELALSRSTLARRLAALDLTQSDVTDYLRVTTARYYLAETEVCIGDIATRLRYSEHSAFTRAFTKMFGKTPKQFRELSQSEHNAALNPLMRCSA